MGGTAPGAEGGGPPSLGSGVPGDVGIGDAALIDAISRSSVPAFVEFFDRTAEAVRAALAALPAGTGQREEVLAASYLEVWWLAGCYTERDRDAIEWITGIGRRRIAEARAGPDGERLIGGTPSGHALRELAALLRRPVGDLAPE